MKYQNYERKIKAIKRAKDMIHSVRFWIIGGVSAAVVTTGTLLGVIGIPSIGEVNETIEYGQSYSLQNGALMADSHLEYAPFGTNDWTKTQPSYVGKYKVRTVSKNGVGIQYHTNEKEFEIVPKKIEFNVKSDSLIYGQKPELASYSLVGDDKLTNYKLDATEIDLETNKCLGVFDEDAFVITNSIGSDVTFCYDITANEKTLDFHKRAIGIEIGGSSKEYDGTPLSSNEYNITSGSLLEGDNIVLGGNVEVTEISTIENSQSITIKNEKGEDVTSYYEINPTYLNLEVTKRNIKIKSSTVDREYDGTSVADELSYTIEEGSLLAGDRLEVTFANKDIVKPTNGRITNTYSYHIFDSQNNEVTSRYEVTPTAGYISIAKRALTYTTEGVEKVYDGRSFQSFEVNYDESELASTDRIVKVGSPTSYVNTTGDEVTQNVITVEIYNENNEIVTDCYDLNPIYGDILISKRQVKFDLPAYSGEYDGNVHILEDFQIVTNYGDGLLSGHHALIVNPLELFGANEGRPSLKYSTLENNTHVRIIDGSGEDVSGLYDISYIHHESLITRRALEISPLYKSKEYDGENLFTEGDLLTENDYAISYGSLARFDQITATYAQSANEATNGLNMNDQEEQHGVYNINVEIRNTTMNALRVDENYTLSMLQGRYDITKPTIHFSTMDYTKTYDGTDNLPLPALQENVLWKLEGELKPGHRIYNTPEVVSTGNVDVGSHPLTFKTKPIIYDSTNKNVTSNYNILYSENAGSLNITPRSITIAPTATEFTYDGQLRVIEGTWRNSDVHTGDFTVIGSLAEGDMLSVGDDNSVVNYRYEDTGNDADFSNVVITNKNNDPVNDNYVISYSTTSKYNIHKRPITITTASASKFYNGQYVIQNTLTAENKAITDDIHVEWPSEEELKTCRPLNVTDTNNPARMYNTVDLENISIVNSITEEDVTNSYDITLVLGTLEVKRCPIAIEFTGISHTYNGSAYRFNYFEVNAQSGHHGARLEPNEAFPDLPSNFHVLAYIDSSDLSSYIYYTPGAIDLTDKIYFTVKTDLGEVLLENSNVVSGDDNFIIVKRNSLNFSVAKRTISISNYGGDYIYYDGLIASEKKIVTGLATNDYLYFIKDMEGFASLIGNEYNEYDVYQYLEAYNSATTNYESQENMSSIGSYMNSIDIGKCVILHKEPAEGGMYTNITSSYNITQDAKEVVIH